MNYSLGLFYFPGGTDDAPTLRREAVTAVSPHFRERPGAWLGTATGTFLSACKTRLVSPAQPLTWLEGVKEAAGSGSG